MLLSLNVCLLMCHILKLRCCLNVFSSYICVNNYILYDSNVIFETSTALVAAILNSIRITYANYHPTSIFCLKIDWFSNIIQHFHVFHVSNSYAIITVKLASLMAAILD